MSFEKASELPEHQQQLLYCCAFWIMSADEELQAGEQTWLAGQFGEAHAGPLLEDCLALSGGAFLATFDRLAAELTDDERRMLYQRIPGWLTACAEADGSQSVQEIEIADRIMDRLGLRRDLDRLALATPTAAPAFGAQTPATSDARTMAGHTGAITALTASPDGQVAWSAAMDGTVRQWDLAGFSERASIHVHESGVEAVVILPEGHPLTVDRRGHLARWKPGQSQPVWRVLLKGDPSSLALNPTGKLVAVALLRGSVIVADTDSGEERLTLAEEKRSALRAIAFSPDGKWVAGGGDGKTITLWRADTGAESATLEGHESIVTAVCWHPDGEGLFSASRDNTVRRWDPVSGRAVRTYEGHRFSVCGLAVSEDGALLASASGDHTVRLWDVASGETRTCYEDTIDGFNAVAFVPGSHRLLAGGAGKLVYVLDATT